QRRRFPRERRPPGLVNRQPPAQLPACPPPPARDKRRRRDGAATRPRAPRAIAHQVAAGFPADEPATQITRCRAPGLSPVTERPPVRGLFAARRTANGQGALLKAAWTDSGRL